MAPAEQNVTDLLDELAIKIMMIEPGDLSAVGELLDILEKLQDQAASSSQTALQHMASAVQAALQQVIMGELSDSDDTFEQFAECVSRMQEVVRDGEDTAVLNAFCSHLDSIGFKIALPGLRGDQTAETNPFAGELPFLKDKELLECFIEESADYLGSIEIHVLELEKDAGNNEALNAIFRSFHTIKGTAGSIALDEISRLAHATENLLAEVRNGEIAMDSSVTEAVLSIGDALRAMVDHVQEVYERGILYSPPEIEPYLAVIHGLMGKEKDDITASSEIQSEDAVATGDQSPASEDQKEDSLDFLSDVDLLSGFISEAFEHLESIELNVLELELNPQDNEIINNIFRPFHTIKGVSGFLNLKTINKLAHMTENLLDDVRNGKLAMGSVIIDIVLGVGDTLRTMIQNVSDVLEQGPQAYRKFDISEHLDHIQEARGAGTKSEEKLSSPPSSAPPQPVPATEMANSADFVTKTASDLSPSTFKPEDISSSSSISRRKSIEAAIKVDIRKLDGLVNAVGELVIMQAMVRHNPIIDGLSDPKLNKDFAQLTRITTDLQKTAMSMRMVPIRQTFQKMTRLVRDLSKKTGKIVNLVMQGEETEIDRNMVDSIYDPLVHMMRNSVDHGVQPPEQRRLAGKPEAGTVKLSAYQKGGNIIIEIVDDGEGVNTAKIREKALERGLIQKDSSLSDYEINNLIFLPGFSTADKITDVSGRGVGMDVVKKGVEKLRGKVELQSTPGVGSLFLMYLPLTLAIIDGIVVRVGEERYIIPTIAIRESMRPDMECYNTVQGKGETLLVRDTLIPIIRLYQIFGVENACTEISEGITVIVENEGRQRALLVDELLGKQEVVIKSLGGYMKDIKGVAGGTILGDGRVGLILDLSGLINTSDDMDTAVA